jgi:hypothetical protein
VVPVWSRALVRPGIWLSQAPLRFPLSNPPLINSAARCSANGSTMRIVDVARGLGRSYRLKDDLSPCKQWADRCRGQTAPPLPGPRASAAYQGFKARLARLHESSQALKSIASPGGPRCAERLGSAHSSSAAHVVKGEAFNCVIDPSGCFCAWNRSLGHAHPQLAAVERTHEGNRLGRPHVRDAGGLRSLASITRRLLQGLGPPAPGS